MLSHARVVNRPSHVSHAFHASHPPPSPAHPASPPAHPPAAPSHLHNVRGELAKAVNVCEEPFHRFKVSIFVGLSIGVVFATLDTVRDVTLDLLSEWNTSPSLLIALLAQLLFVAGFLFLARYFVASEVM